MEVRCEVVLRGRTSEVVWIDGVVHAEPEVLRRLRQTTALGGFDEVLSLLHAVEDAFGLRPDFRVVHDVDDSRAGPRGEPADAAVVDLVPVLAARAGRRGLRDPSRALDGAAPDPRRRPGR